MYIIQLSGEWIEYSEWRFFVFFLIKALTSLSLLIATFTCILSPSLSIIYQYKPIKYTSESLVDLLI